jgi:class 3 adenylate cyclase
MHEVYGGAPVQPERGIYISRIILNGDSVLSAADLEKLSDPVKGLVIDYDHNDIRFELTDSGKSELQFNLIGFDGNSKTWQRTTYKEYTNLKAGTYVFCVSVKNLSGETGEELRFRFTILPKWYFSTPAIVLYLIIAAMAIWAIYDYLMLRFARTQYTLEQIINKRTEDLIIEKEKSENLLANVLPKDTAQELMLRGKATKMKYNFVTVLFSDIQGFTKIAEEMNPEVLIDELDKFFFHFDSVVEKYGIEKIKTIGDAYMCAGGIPEKNRTNPIEITLAAIEMQKYMNNLKEVSKLEGIKYWDIRIGIHTGTVVAGVVGQKKLSYDIWGDTVNTASRMESAGEAGKINISGTTYEFVKDFFICEHRGKMPVKYKGELDMYFVNGILPGLCEEDGNPNRQFFLKMQLLRLQDIEDIVSNLFDHEAPPNLYFHNSSMFRSIVNSVEILANAEIIFLGDYINLKLASIFLITGYITDYHKPMEASIRLAGELLPKYGFDNENLEKTKELIFNSFRKVYNSISDKILHDARYEYLGRVDYLKLSEKLLKERTEYGKTTERNEWIDYQRRQLIEHDFLTKTAKLLRSIDIEEQIAALQETPR